MGSANDRGMNRECIGKAYEGQPDVVRVEDVLAFAEATSDTNPAYQDAGRPGGIVAPPLFPVKYCNRLYLAVFKDRDLRVDFPRLLFGEMAMRFFAPLRPGDEVRSMARIEGIEDKETGQLLSVVTTVECGGEPRCEARAGFFVRSAAPRPRTEKPREPPASGPAMAVAFEESMPIRHDQPNLFARAAEDPNPIHVDDDFARSVGLPGRILHGLCSMAFTSRAFVTRACDGDPSRLRRLKVRFSKPALPGQTITTRAFQPEPLPSGLLYRFVAETSPGVLIITNGEAEIAAG